MECIVFNCLLRVGASTFFVFCKTATKNSLIIDCNIDDKKKKKKRHSKYAIVECIQNRCYHFNASLHVQKKKQTNVFVKAKEKTLEFFFVQRLKITYNKISIYEFLPLFVVVVVEALHKVPQ